MLLLAGGGVAAYFLWWKPKTIGAGYTYPADIPLAEFPPGIYEENGEVVRGYPSDAAKETYNKLKELIYGANYMNPAHL